MGDKMAKKKKDPLKSLGASALGLGGLGLSVGVSGAVAGRAAAGTPAAGITGGLPMIASGARIATTAKVGKDVLSSVSGKKYKKKIKKFKY